jgi:hypothetical protein
MGLAYQGLNVWRDALRVAGRLTAWAQQRRRKPWPAGDQAVVVTLIGVAVLDAAWRTGATDVHDLAVATVRRRLEAPPGDLLDPAPALSTGPSWHHLVTAATDSPSWVGLRGRARGVLLAHMLDSYDPDGPAPLEDPDLRISERLDHCPPLVTVEAEPTAYSGYVERGTSPP